MTAKQAILIFTFCTAILSMALCAWLEWRRIR